ncbi:MAG TPA: serine hydrolase domain-containing protein [Pirellulales bacterium]|nr:serine hydrolase domain-containing protein [Pirellulales bacterium]
MESPTVRYLAIFACLFVCSLPLGHAHAQSELVKAAMQPFVDSGEVSGLVTFIGNKNGVLDVQVLGLADLDNKLPMRRDSLFRIASMTKPITALAVMQLVEQGKVYVDDPVEKYLPEFAGQMLAASRDNDGVTLKRPSRPVAVKDLLTHTSGLANYPPGLADVYQKRNRTLSETTIAVSQAPLMFEPGSRWSYCNAGIDTLGRLIEVVSGVSYDAYLATHIFQPLGMFDTTPYPSAGQLERLAITYGKEGDKLVAQPGGVLDYAAGAKHPVPAGGLFSTGDDLARLYQCLLNGGTLRGRRIINEKTLADMTGVHTGDLKAGFVDGSAWGYGFGLVSRPQGVTESLSSGTFGHGGAYGTQAWIDPTTGIYTVLLLQRSGLPNSDASPMRKALHEAAANIAGQRL